MATSLVELVRGNSPSSSDHFPNFVIIDNSNTKRKNDSDNYKRNTKKYNQIVFVNDLLENFSAVYNQDLDTNELSKSILDTFTQTLDINAPMEKMTKKRN